MGLVEWRKETYLFANRGGCITLEYLCFFASNLHSEVICSLNELNTRDVTRVKASISAWADGHVFCLLNSKRDLVIIE